MLELIFLGAVGVGLVNLWCTPTPETAQLIKDAKNKERLKEPMSSAVYWENELNRRALSND